MLFFEWQTVEWPEDSHQTKGSKETWWLVDDLFGGYTIQYDGPIFDFFEILGWYSSMNRESVFDHVAQSENDETGWSLMRCCIENVAVTSLIVCLEDMLLVFSCHWFLSNLKLPFQRWSSGNMCKHSTQGAVLDMLLLRPFLHQSLHDELWALAGRRWVESWDMLGFETYTFWCSNGCQPSYLLEHFAFGWWWINHTGTSRHQGSEGQSHHHQL